MTTAASKSNMTEKILMKAQNNADRVIEYLKKKGINQVFVYPGGTIAPLVNSCIKYDVKIEVFKSEQGAGYAALAYARLTQKPQIVMVTSGPGVTNIISTIADAYYDSTPLIVITGQIGTSDLNTRTNVRQRGFQEVPTIEITKPISKLAVCIDSKEKIDKFIHTGYSLTQTLRPGPVIFDFPMNIQREGLSEDEQSIDDKGINSDNSIQEIDINKLQNVIKFAINSTRPVILLGQGALKGSCPQIYREIASKMKAKVATSLLGIGSYDERLIESVGYIGHTGHYTANKCVYECDFLLVIGSRLDLRQTGTKVNEFVPNGKIAWVNNDIHEIENPRIKADWSFNADAEVFGSKLLGKLRDREVEVDKEWIDSINTLKNSNIEDQPRSTKTNLQPREVIREIDKSLCGLKTIIVTGVGCHQHWAARHINYIPKKCQLLTSGGHGTMGYDLPSAIGAAICEPEALVVCIVGDGSMLMNIQELASISERELNVKIMVMNNNRLGIVSQFQNLTWNNDPTTGVFKTPDFALVAKGFGINSKTLNKQSKLKEEIRKAVSQKGPFLLDILVEHDADIVPMLLPGQNMGQMWMGDRNG